MPHKYGTRPGSARTCPINALNRTLGDGCPAGVPPEPLVASAQTRRSFEEHTEAAARDLTDYCSCKPLQWYRVTAVLAAILIALRRHAIAGKVWHVLSS